MVSRFPALVPPSDHVRLRHGHETPRRGKDGDERGHSDVSVDSGFRETVPGSEGAGGEGPLPHCGVASRMLNPPAAGTTLFSRSPAAFKRVWNAAPVRSLAQAASAAWQKRNKNQTLPLTISPYLL